MSVVWQDYPLQCAIGDAMTPSLIESLKWLAEKKPNSFAFHEDKVTWVHRGEWSTWKYPHRLTQDDVDEILAGIGLFYMLRPSSDSETTNLKSWGWTIAPLEKIIGNSEWSSEDFPSKSEAKDAALIAGIKRKKGEMEKEK